MRHKDTDELARWLAAEQAESGDDADALFAAVASRHLPLLPEPAGLTARIMAALPRKATAGRLGEVLDVAGSWWVRATVAAAVGVLGVAFATISLGQLLDFSARSVEALARLTSGLATSLSAAVGVCGVAWAVLMNLGRAAIVVASSGSAPVLIGANVLLACLAFAGLSRLLSPREECC